MHRIVRMERGKDFREDFNLLKVKEYNRKIKIKKILYFENSTNDV